MKSITKAALGGVAGCALILGATQAASGESPILSALFGDTLTDLTPVPAPSDPSGTTFDNAKATVRIMETPEDGTGFKLRVEGIDPAAAGIEFGSHLHIGDCQALTETTGDMTGTHYQHDPELGVTRANEVWFDLVPSDRGVATYDTFRPFVVEDPDGDNAMSIVIHQKATNVVDGKAGTKEACLPLSVSKWKPVS